jgi:hypothetical protein
MDPMSAELHFFFLLGSVVCLALASVRDASGLGRRATRRLPDQLSLLPLGLALFVFPLMWDAGAAAF